MLGLSILVSAAVLHVRKRAFEKRFDYIIDEARQKRRALKSTARARPRSPSRSRAGTNDHPRPEVDGIVVRGRSILSHDLESGQEMNRPVNPGNYPPSERMDAAATVNEGLETRTLKSSQPDQVKLDSSTLVDMTPTRPQGTQQSSRVDFIEPAPISSRQRKRVSSLSGVGARNDLLNHPRMAQTPRYPIPLAALTSEKPELPQDAATRFMLGGFISPKQRCKTG